jgi:hypothetical protein
MSNVSDFLKQLDTLNVQTSVDVYVPSLKRVLKFKPLNLKQQKNLLKSSVEDILTKLSFTTNFYSIILENILETININDLYVFDRIAIAIALRNNAVDSNYIQNGNVYNLQTLINNYPSLNIDQSLLNGRVEIQNLVVELEAPRLGIDRDISSAVLNKMKNSGSTTNDVKTLIGELFINEVIKFIKSVTFKTEAGDNALIFNDIKLDERLTIVEKLSTTVTNQILDFIKKYRDFENQYSKIDNSFVEIDGSFFTI